MAVLDAISASVADLRGHLDKVMTEPKDFINRPHEVLEDMLRFQLMGYTDQGGGAEYAEVQAGAAATRALLDQVAPLVAPRDPGLLPKAKAQLDALEAALRATQADGKWQPLADVAPQRRRVVAGALGEVLETLADVPPLLELPTRR
ncbi:hypothetical protein HMPREF9336_03510 [Segniliparus rugosus ATCC BAA-974]|uniref:Uncharacterized protein n=1 Tax=Segniliparus rugosus (strain ATCC BAA-974 / DSM 45345 / CCUG 50838 / CIP 108380 / JCM 13579 / CDC 945) TaxID=679197 RepID=U1M1W0_SEGRC|nr:hypothetical protein HMPREF9336_03510 [Segniliparus rugosus ATCC BAA-974]